MDFIRVCQYVCFLIKYKQNLFINKIEYDNFPRGYLENYTPLDETDKYKEFIWHSILENERQEYSPIAIMIRGVKLTYMQPLILMTLSGDSHEIYNWHLASDIETFKNILRITGQELEVDRIYSLTNEEMEINIKLNPPGVEIIGEEIKQEREESKKITTKEEIVDHIITLETEIKTNPTEFEKILTFNIIYNAPKK